MQTKKKLKIQYMKWKVHEVFKIRLDEAEDWISELEDEVEINTVGATKWKKTKKEQR